MQATLDENVKLEKKRVKLKREKLNTKFRKIPLLIGDTRNCS